MQEAFGQDDDCGVAERYNDEWAQLPFLRFAHHNGKAAETWGRIATVVAHPDDETIGCGALIAHMPSMPIILVTDGAPRNLPDGQQLGFKTARSYATARLREWWTALHHAGVQSDQLFALGIPDQECSFRIAEIARNLASLFVKLRISTVLTHAYEGGHPDHDSVALAVELASYLTQSSGCPVQIFEMPFYRLGHDRLLHQCFAPNCEPDFTVRLTARERQIKRRMLDSYVTQRKVLSSFGVDFERFRLASPHRFAQAPNSGRLAYEWLGFGMTAPHWQALASAAVGDIQRSVA